MMERPSLEERIARSNRYYAKHAGRVSDRTRGRDYSRALDVFCGAVPHGARVVDAGCGTGEHLRLLAQRGVTPVGVDPSAEMRAIAQTHGFTVLDGTLESLDELQLGEVRGVWIAAALLHVPEEDLDRALRAVRSVIAEGGALFITTRCGGGRTWDRYDDRDDEAARLIQLYSVDQIIEALGALGFDVIESWTEQSTWGRPPDWMSIVARTPAW